MTKLNQILAVEKGAKARSESAVTAIYHGIQQQGLFAGRIRTYEPKDDDGDRLPSETQLVVSSAETLVRAFGVAETEVFDITATKVYANCDAKADVVVEINGEPVTLIHQAPVEFLLFLEKRLTDAATFLGKLPILDPTQKWAFDAANGWYASAPVDRIRSVKVLKNHVKAEATDKHPAQVETFTADEMAGTWTTIELSGAMPSTERAVLQARVAKLAAAVKMAREEANSREVTQISVGETVFSYLFPVSTV